jgi:hypothetical protein
MKITVRNEKTLSDVRSVVGRKGARERAIRLTKAERSEIAKRAAKARWSERNG